ncbi:mitogen-activated protein kinase-2 [Mycena olivaceomarginata]|nr:mitogen-activated protein kinase-2 [Mycena olivaceomarginata]
MHSAGIVHRDLKPSNLLINANCDLKICDLGLARSVQIVAAPDGDCMTEYVATRWYRAPEIMLSFRNYTAAIDLWSVGCILAELFLRQPLFPGKHYIEQLHMILAVLGTPSEEQVYSITSTSSRKFLRTLPLWMPIPLRPIFALLPPPESEDNQTFEPNKRLSANQAIAHPYMDVYHDPDDEPDCPPPEASYLEFDLDGKILLGKCL